MLEVVLKALKHIPVSFQQNRCFKPKKLVYSIVFFSVDNIWQNPKQKTREVPNYTVMDWRRIEGSEDFFRTGHRFTRIKLTCGLPHCGDLLWLWWSRKKLEQLNHITEALTPISKKRWVHFPKSCPEALQCSRLWSLTGCSPGVCCPQAQRWCYIYCCQSQSVQKALWCIIFYVVQP